MPIHMDISQETVNRILGESLVESSHFDLVVHTHWAEQEIEYIEQNDAYRNTFFLLSITLAEKISDFESAEKRRNY